MNLNVGDFRILGRVQSYPLRHWFHAINQVTGKEVIAFPCSVPGDKLRSRVDFGSVRSQLAVQADGLQVFDYFSVNSTRLPNGRLLQGLIVSNLPPGCSLGCWVKGSGGLRGAEAIAIGKAIGVGLSAIHKASLVHGELSPSRIWVSNDGDVLLLRPVRTSVGLENSLLPTHDWFEEDVWGQGFVAPELRHGTHEIDFCADIFSLGAVILYVAIGESFGAVRFPVELDQLQLSESPDPLMGLLGLCLESDPSKRICSIDTVLDALGEIRLSTGVGQTDIGKRTTSLQWCAKHRHLPYEFCSSKDLNLQVSLPTSTSDKAFSYEQTTSATIKLPAKSRSLQANTNLSNSDASVCKNSKSPRTQDFNRAKKAQLKVLLLIISASSLLVTLSLAIPYLLKQKTVPAANYPSRERQIEVEGKLGANSKISISGHNPDSLNGYGVAENVDLLWESPWSSGTQAVSLELVVPGAEMIAVIRPAFILDNQISRYWRLWFPHEYSVALNAIEQRLGVDLSLVDRVVISCLEIEGGGQNVLWSVFLRKPLSVKSIKDKIGIANLEPYSEPSNFLPTQERSEVKLFLQEGYQNDDSMVQRYAVGSEAVIALVADVSGNSIPLPYALQAAWAQTSDNADITLLLTPLFLSRYRNGIVAKFSSIGFKDIFAWLSANISALVMSAHVAENVYCEILLVPAAGTSSMTTLVTLEKAVDGLLEKIDQIVGQGEVSTSWRSLAIRLPKLAEFARNNARFGYSRLLPSVNLYLPDSLVPQACLAGLLLISQTESAQSSSFNTSEKMDLTVDQMLEKSLSINFEQESLEQALKILFDEYHHSNPQSQPFAGLQLDGASLEKSGITQNQQVRDFKMLKSSFRSILTALLVKANPDKSAKSSQDSRQSIIWALKQDLESKSVSIVVTTRQGAASLGLTLPPEFLEIHPTRPKKITSP
jgi:serine/threonine protein kinase